MATQTQNPPSNAATPKPKTPKTPEMAREIRLTTAMTLQMRVATMLTKEGNKQLSRSALKLANQIGDFMDSGSNGAAPTS